MDHNIGALPDFLDWCAGGFRVSGRVRLSRGDHYGWWTVIKGMEPVRRGNCGHFCLAGSETLEIAKPANGD